MNKKAEIMMILSMCIFGTIGLFVRYINVTSSEIALYRALLASILIGIYLLLTKQKIPFHSIKKQLPLLIASGVMMGFNWILLFEAYKYTSISMATLAYYFAPIIMMVASVILFKETLTKKQILCFIMSTIGILLISVNTDVTSGNNHFVGILFGLGAAILYASVVLINKSIKNVDGISRTYIQFISASIILLPYVLFTSGINLMNLDLIGFLCLFIVGFLHTGITYCLYFTSLKDVPAQKTAILSYVDPLVAIIISVFILKETITIIQMIGGLLILGFTLYNEISTNKTL